MKTSDLMTRAAVTDSPDDTLAEASAKMHDEQTGSLLVMEQDRLTGIVCERDVLRTLAVGKDPKTFIDRDVMTCDDVTINPATNVMDGG